MSATAVAMRDLGVAAKSAADAMRGFTAAYISGIDLVPSAVVPEGQLLEVEGRLLYHSRLSRRERWRRPHGRTNGPRRRVVTVVRYQPDYDRLLAAIGPQNAL